MSVKSKAQLHTDNQNHILGKTEQYSLSQYDVGNLLSDIIDSSVNEDVRPLTLQASYDLSDTNDFPLSGGTGDSGEVLRGNIFPVSSPDNDGTLDWGDGDGPVLVPNGALLLALDDDPGSDPTKWRQL